MAAHAGRHGVEDPTLFFSADSRDEGMRLSYQRFEGILLALEVEPPEDYMKEPEQENLYRAGALK